MPLSTCNMDCLYAAQANTTTMQLRRIINNLTRENMQLRQQLRDRTVSAHQIDISQLLEDQIDVANLKLQIQSLSLELHMCKLDTDLSYDKLHSTLFACTAFEATMMEQRDNNAKEITCLEDSLLRMEQKLTQHMQKESLLQVQLQEERTMRATLEKNIDQLLVQLKVKDDEQFRIDQMYKCVVCMDADRSMLTLCGHLACCETCYLNLKFNYVGQCPLCRYPFDSEDFQVKFG